MSEPALELTLQQLNRFLTEYIRQNYRHAAYCHGRGNDASKAGNAAERDQWMTRARTIEELLDPLADAQQLIWRRHPGLKIPMPNELLPPELRKGPRLVVDNDSKK